MQPAEFSSRTIASLASALLLLAATPCLAQSTAAAPSKPGLDDATIVAIFDAANSADIETGQLAAQRGQSSRVRDFGAVIAHDHQVVRQQGRDLAQRLHVTPTPPRPDAGAASHARAMKELRDARGADFDARFLRHEVAFHQQVIDDVQQTLLPAIRNEELKALVEKVAPAFQAHLIAAQQLQRELGEKATAASHAATDGKP